MGRGRATGRGPAARAGPSQKGAAAGEDRSRAMHERTQDRQRQIGRREGREGGEGAEENSLCKAPRSQA